MKVALFEGPEVMRPHGVWTWGTVLKDGKEVKAKLPDFTPGEPKGFPGWRNYLMMMWPEGFPVRVVSSMGTEAGAVRLCHMFRARFYPEGTWEASPALPGQLPAVRPGVIAEILGKPQPELAL